MRLRCAWRDRWCDGPLLSVHAHLDEDTEADALMCEYHALLVFGDGVEIRPVAGDNETHERSQP